MGEIAAKINQLRSSGKKALISFLVGGFPSRAEFPAVLASVRQISDVVEIGVPFSDPLADGPVIQQASRQALEQGVTLRWILRTTARTRRGQHGSAPLVLMTYLNPLLSLGKGDVSECIRKVREAGIGGLIVPDLPVDEAEPYESAAASQGLDLIHLVAPTTGPARARRIAERSRGFVYVVSLTGVTGARDELAEGTLEFLQRLRATTDMPLCVGFGISKPEHVACVVQYADGVIVGSALVRVVAEGHAGPAEDAMKFLRKLRQSLDKGVRAQKQDGCGRGTVPRG